MSALPRGRYLTRDPVKGWVVVKDEGRVPEPEPRPKPNAAAYRPDLSRACAVCEAPPGCYCVATMHPERRT